MIRLRSKDVNNSGLISNIYIYDRELEASTFDTFITTPEFYKINFEGDRNDPFKRIIPAKASINILTGLNHYTVGQQAAIMSFYEDLVNSYEGRFYIRITRGEGLGNIFTVFTGKILPDIGDFVLSNISDFTITAIDGLTLLKDIEYRPTGYSDLTAEFAIRTIKFKDHFLDILKRNDVVEYFNGAIALGNTVFMTTSGNWTESLSDTGDIFNQVRVRNYWFEQKTPTYRKYQNCYDVLNDLLTGFNARLFYSNGVYHIEQLGYQDNLTPTIYGYDYGGGAIFGTYYDDKVQHNYDTNTNLKAGPYISSRRLLPFKAVELEQSKQFTNFMNGMDLTIGDISGSFMGNHGPHNYGYVIGTGNKLVLQWFVDILLGTAWNVATYSNLINVEWTIRMKVKIGDYYLVADDPSFGGIVSVGPLGQYHVSVGGVIPVLSWTLIDSTITIQWKRDFSSTSLSDFNNQISSYRNFIKNSDLVIESNEIQQDGELVLEFIDFVTKRNGVTIGGTPPGSVSLRKNSRIIVSSGYTDLYEQPKGIKRYEVGDARNSIVYPLKFGYYDSQIATINQLFMTIVGNPLFSEYPTLEWTDPDSGDTLGIEELLMKQVLAMRAIPTNTFNMELLYLNDDFISFRDLIVKNDLIHIPLEMEMIFKGPGAYTTWTVTIWEVYKDYIGINIVDTGTPEVDSPTFPTPDGSLDLYTPGGSNIGLQYYEEFENVATNYVTLTDFSMEFEVNVDDDLTNKTKWLIYINGVRQRYLDGTLVNRTFKFDVDNNRIYFFKGAGNVAHIEVFKYY